MSLQVMRRGSQRHGSMMWCVNTKHTERTEPQHNCALYALVSAWGFRVAESEDLEVSLRGLEGRRWRVKTSNTDLRTRDIGDVQLVLLVILTRARVALGSLTLVGAKTKAAVGGWSKTGAMCMCSLSRFLFLAWFLLTLMGSRPRGARTTREGEKWEIRARKGGADARQTQYTQDSLGSED